MMIRIERRGGGVGDLNVVKKVGEGITGGPNQRGAGCNGGLDQNGEEGEGGGGWH